MRDIIELATAIANNRADGVALDDELARHPQAIAQVFETFTAHDGCRTLVSHIERLEEYSGWTRGRKNQFEWHGYRYRIAGDPKEYWMRCGNNWCAAVDDCGEYGDDGCEDIDMSVLQTDLDGENADGCEAPKSMLDSICTLPTWQAVGYLLRLKMGV